MALVMLIAMLMGLNMQDYLKKLLKEERAYPVMMSRYEVKVPKQATGDR